MTVVQLPAVNTPQFQWTKTRMPRHPQPVPPIFQPEVIAEAIVWAAHQRRREVTVGWSAVKAILGDKFIPKLLDHYLARVGYSVQQTSEPVARDRPHNLWEPLPGDHGAHGAFDDRARTYSLQWWLNKHRNSLAMATVGLIAGILCTWRTLSKDGEPRTVSQDGRTPAVRPESDFLDERCDLPYCIEEREQPRSRSVGHPGAAS